MINRPNWLCNWIAWFDYGIGLPLISQLPPDMAKWFIRLRGTINFLFDLEWRTLALRQGYVRSATLQAMRAICQMTNSKRSPLILTLRRFIVSSWEEYDAQRLARINYASVLWYGQGMDKILETIRSGRGVVLLTGHFDSLYVGLMILANQGVHVNVMSSKIVDASFVQKEIRDHFKKKITTMAKHFYPGKVSHFEDGMKHIVNALKRGEILVIACDGPSTAINRGSVVNFLGNNYVMAAGPEFFAKKTAVPISMYTCVRESDGRFRIDFSTPATFEENGLQLAYNDLSKRICAEPWRWWAADLYRTYQKPKPDKPEPDREIPKDTGTRIKSDFG